MAINESIDGSLGGAFESMHSWSGVKLPEPESEAFQNGKAAAVRKLLPHTQLGVVEAAVAVIKLTGAEYDFKLGNQTNVSITLPTNDEEQPVAVLHSHSRDIVFSAEDWATFLTWRNVQQLHAVVDGKTYSLHKPQYWRHVEAPTASEVADSYDAYMWEFWQRAEISNVTITPELERAYCCKKLCAQYGILFRYGIRLGDEE